MTKKQKAEKAAIIIYTLISAYHELRTGKGYYCPWNKIPKDEWEGFYVKNVADYWKAEGIVGPVDYFLISQKNRRALGWKAGNYDAKKKTTPLLRERKPNATICLITALLDEMGGLPYKEWSF